MPGISPPNNFYSPYGRQLPDGSLEISNAPTGEAISTSFKVTRLNTILSVSSAIVFSGIVKVESSELITWAAVIPLISL